MKKNLLQNLAKKCFFYKFCTKTLIEGFISRKMISTSEQHLEHPLLVKIYNSGWLDRWEPKLI